MLHQAAPEKNQSDAAADPLVAIHSGARPDVKLYFRQKLTVRLRKGMLLVEGGLIQYCVFWQPPLRDILNLAVGRAATNDVLSGNHTNVKIVQGAHSGRGDQGSIASFFRKQTPPRPRAQRSVASFLAPSASTNVKCLSCRTYVIGGVGRVAAGAHCLYSSAKIPKEEVVCARCVKVGGLQRAFFRLHLRRNLVERDVWRAAAATMRVQGSAGFHRPTACDNWASARIERSRELEELDRALARFSHLDASAIHAASSTHAGRPPHAIAGMPGAAIAVTEASDGSWRVHRSRDDDDRM